MAEQYWANTAAEKAAVRRLVKSGKAVIVATERMTRHGRTKLICWEGWLVEPVTKPDTRTADRIDGYDRDDIGESPDY